MPTASAPNPLRASAAASSSRRSARAPLAVRLSLLSISRDPGRPAATLTLLAFSVGAIVFATCWAATLREGIDESAAYRAGLDLRVRELGTGLSISRSVVPIDRYAELGSDIRTVPVFRETTATQPGGRVEMLGIDPTALPTLPGWRGDFSSVPVDELAARLHVDPPAGGWQACGSRPRRTPGVTRSRWTWCLTGATARWRSRR